VGPASVLNLSFAILSAAAAAFNLWIWRERRREPAHLWLAVAAGAVAVISVGRAGFYEGTSLAEVDLWQRLMFAASAPLIVGFLRFSFCFLGAWNRAVDRIGLGVGLAGAVCALGTPWILDDTAHPKVVPWFAQPYLEAGLDPLGLFFFFIYGALFVYIIWLYGRHLGRVEDHPIAIFATLCVWAMLATNDMAVTLGLYSGIYVLGLGYAAFWAAFSAILVRRFVRSSEDVERWAQTLQRLVDERTAELRERELQLADGQRLATLATLAASCAHELNNPAAYVTSSLNRLSELAKREGAEDAAEFDEILGECREGVERIRSVVGELIALARRSDGEREPVDVARVVEGALGVARGEARFRAEIVAALQPVPRVLGDARLLGQVALQLLLNGIEAAVSGASGRPRVGVETSFEDGSVWLVVRDNGPGIPEALRPRLFDPLFARGERVRPGLGLAVTHQIVTSHGGRIDVESGADGTTIVVELPPAKA
jgi:signal transduction histidine kinase